MRAEYREEPCKNALHRVRGMPFRWSLNPYGGCLHRCTFCYVRAFELRADRPADWRYGLVIRVKTNIADRLALELARPGWRRELVAIGTATDPYQPIEGTYRLTRRCLEVLARARTPASLVTRSPLVVRDVDVLGELARRAGVSVAFSIPTLDERVWRATEPGTPPPRQRLRALERLRQAGLDAGVALAPLLPGLTDHPTSISAVLAAARDAGAAFVWAAPLRLPPGTREHFLQELRDTWPALVPVYEHRFAGTDLRPAEARALSSRVEAAARRLGLPLGHRNPEGREGPEQLPLWKSPHGASARASRS